LTAGFAALVRLVELTYGERTRLGRIPMITSKNLRSASIAGAIALVIYLVISLLTGASFGASIGFGVLLGIFTFVVSLAIYTVITNAKSKRA
jgi:hypothetical protein